jgi:hypothetical protein
MTALTTLHTDGSGLYTSKAKAVRIIKLKLGFVDEDRTFGELRVFFDKADWDCDTDSDIYTDRLFEKELREYLTSKGYTARNSGDVGYSELGMQGDSFVSLDVNEAFLASWSVVHFPNSDCKLVEA